MSQTRVDDHARVAPAAQLIGRRQRWVCDIGSGRERLNDYLSLDSVYLPADVTKWHEGVELCDLNANQFPERSLAACDVAVLLGVLQVIRDPQALFHQLSERVEYVLISHRSKESNPSDKMQTFSNRQMETFLVEAGFQPLSYGGDGTQVLFYAVNTKFTKEQATKRWIARSGFELPTKKQLLRRWLGKLRII